MQGQKPERPLLVPRMPQGALVTGVGGVMQGGRGEGGKGV